MKTLHLITVILFINTTFNAQNFTWVKGSNTAGMPGVYGTMGVSAAANTPCGRHACGKWVDLNGNLWLFGGEGPSNSWRNDLWKYNITTNEWTWIRGSNTVNIPGVYGTQGVPSSSNDPGSREFPTCWTDASGNFWLFGGDGYDINGTTFGRLGDLWKYNPTTNQWTWVKGFTSYGQNGIYGTLGVSAPANAPGSRYGTGIWTDAAGDFWMFGGRGLGAIGTQGYLDDLWKYNIASNQWTWISGSNAVGQYGTYGTPGVSSPANIPGGRYLPASWKDASGNMYLFGGVGFAITNPTITSADFLNDLWKYDPLANAWTWVGGSSGLDALGIYGTQNTSSALNGPGGRFGQASWTDASGNFWLFGGNGYASNSTVGWLNDLFRYNPGMNQWTWVKGSNLPNQNGIYGTIGVTAPTNMPGGRLFNTWWKDLSGKFWLFGGEGYDISNTSPDHMNDVWSFSVPCSADSITVAPGKIICSGASLTFSAVNGGPSTIWYPTAISTASISGGSTLSVSSLTTAASPAVYSYFAESNDCSAGPRASINITVNALPTLTATATRTLICKNESTVLNVGGAASYSWSTTPALTTASITVSPLITTTYIVTGTDANNCQSSSSIVVAVVATCAGIKENSNNDVLCSIFPNPNRGQFTVNMETDFTRARLIIINAIGEKIFEQDLNSTQTIIKPGINKGLYYYNIIFNNDKKATGKLIIE